VNTGKLTRITSEMELMIPITIYGMIFSERAPRVHARPKIGWLQRQPTWF
jgi:hypothetical protein